MAIYTKDSYIKRTVIGQVGISTHYILAFLYIFVFSSFLSRVRGIAAISSILLVQILVTVYRQLVKAIPKLFQNKPSKVSWATTGITMGIAVALIIILILTYHWRFYQFF